MLIIKGITDKEQDEVTIHIFSGLPNHTRKQDVQSFKHLSIYMMQGGKGYVGEIDFSLIDINRKSLAGRTKMSLEFF